MFTPISDLIVTSGGNNHTLLSDYNCLSFKVVRSTARGLAFCTKLHNLANKYEGLEGAGPHPFRLDSGSHAGWRRQIAEYFTAEYPPLHAGPVRVSLGFHAVPTTAVADAILDGNFAVLSKRDAGFYGQGIYFSLDAHYCMEAYADGGGEGDEGAGQAPAQGDEGPGPGDEGSAQAQAQGQGGGGGGGVGGTCPITCRVLSRA